MEVVSDNQVRPRLLMNAGSVSESQQLICGVRSFVPGSHARVPHVFPPYGQRRGLPSSLCSDTCLWMVVQILNSATRGDTLFRGAGMGVLPQTSVMPSFS